MTVAPTLQKGLKRLFSASLLRIIAIILAVIGLITMIGGAAVAIGNAITSGGSSAGGIAAGGGAILTIISGILIIVAFFMSLAGIINVSKENDSFKVALYAVLAGIVLSIVKLFVSSGSTLSTVLDLLVNIANILMFLFTCKGIKDVGEKLRRDDIAGKYNSIMVFYCIAAVLQFVGGFLGLQTIGIIFNIIGYVCSIISYFMYLGYLSRASKALEGVPTA